jgi:hypothetical protein
MNLVLPLIPFVLLLPIPFASATHIGVQVTEIVPIPGILIPLSPPAVSRIATLEEDSDLPLMVAAGIVRAVGVVYPDNLVVGQDLVPVPSYKESQVSVSL